ncbi:MAG: SDR family oxidoreductase [Rhizobiales bacterium]|nr:SDR family oxidoreductase [Hyphomicrobiales bacterium]
MSRKVALVTGGTKRIGSAISDRLASAGYALVIHGRDPREAEAKATELRMMGARAASIAGDLADLDGLTILMEAASMPFGPPDVLVNNASLFAKDDLATLDSQQFTANLAVNLQAPVLLAKAFAAQLPEGETGAIINLIDQRVFRVNPHFFSYTLAKAALYTATKTLAQALAPRGIRVNGVGPGPVLPNLHDGTDAFALEAAGTPLGRAVRVGEIAEAVLFLAEAEAVTGQMLAVDSGQHLGWQTPDIVA